MPLLHPLADEEAPLVSNESEKENPPDLDSEDEEILDEIWDRIGRREKRLKSKAPTQED